MKTRVRLYRVLLLLYPASFRSEYEVELVSTMEERSDEARYRGALGRWRLVAFLVADVVRSLPVAHARAWRMWRAGRASRGGRSGPVDLFREVRFAVRGYARRPGFFFAAVLTLGLGVGASTTMFSVADGVALRPLPYPSPDRLVQLGTRYRGYDGIASSNPQDFFDIQRDTRTLRAVAASRLETLTLLGDGDPLQLQGAGVSAAYFEVMGVYPTHGRAFTVAEDRAGQEPVVVLSHGLWQRRFGGDDSVLGRQLDFDGRRFTIIGVMPDDYHPPEAIYHDEVELWYPLAHVGDDLESRDSGFLQAIGRLAPGVDVEEARTELGVLGERIAQTHPESADRQWDLAPLRDQTLGAVGTTLVVLLGAVGFVLLIACANVANLFLVRASERGREMALRTALGANRSALVRLLLIESLVLAVAAAGLAVLLAWGGIAAFRATNPGDIPRLAEITVDLRVLGFALLASLATGIVFGLVPALSGGRWGPGEALREGSANVSPSRRKNRLRGGLVIMQTAVALILLVGAGLLIHSFVKLQRVDPGFETANAVWIQVSIQSSDYPTPESRLAFFTEVKRRFEALPGVESVGGSENTPMGGNSSMSAVSMEGMVLAPDEDPPSIDYNRITEDFFTALQTPVLRGRSFTAADGPGGEPVVIVNETLATRFWPGQTALGERVKFGRPDGEGSWMRVVGVVADLRQNGLGQPAQADLYIPWRLSPRIGVGFIVRSRNEPASLLRALKEAVWSIDSTVPFTRSGTLADHVSESITEPRFYTLLLSTFAALALALAFVGLYGTIAYAVERRTHEIGVRMALGAEADQVVGLVVRRGMLLTAAGLIIGLAGALASTRVLSSFVYGVTPRDPLTIVVTASTLTLAALLACWLPARRASRLDPVRTLRVD